MFSHKTAGLITRMLTAGLAAVTLTAVLPGAASAQDWRGGNRQNRPSNNQNSDRNRTDNRNSNDNNGNRNNGGDRNDYRRPDNNQRPDNNRGNWGNDNQRRDNDRWNDRDNNYRWQDRDRDAREREAREIRERQARELREREAREIREREARERELRERRERERYDRDRYDRDRYDHDRYDRDNGNLWARERDEVARRQATKNDWRNLAYLGAGTAIYGALRHDPTIIFVGAAGALYSLDRYEQDRRSQSDEGRARAEIFSQPYFYRDDVRYNRREVVRDGHRYYQFCRE